MEMKDINEIYPKLPTAPPADEGLNYRLAKINEIQNFLEGEVAKREALSKKYFRVAKIINGVDNGLIVLSSAGAAGGIALLSTVVAIPVGIATQGVAILIGLLGIVGIRGVKYSMAKAEKHEKIKTVANTKLNTIASHVSKALSDNKVTDEEFRLIIEELEKYKKMKEEIRSKSKKKIMSEAEASLIERGRREQRDSFRKLVEKNSAKPSEY